MIRGAGHFSLLFAAARALEMKDDQKDKLDAVAKPFLGLPDPKEGARAVQAELAREVKAGKMEPAKLDPLLASLEKGTKQRRDLEQSGLDALYAALDPGQRKAIVAAIRPRIAVHDAEKAPPPDPGADARVVATGGLAGVVAPPDLPSGSPVSSYRITLSAAAIVAVCDT